MDFQDEEPVKQIFREQSDEFDPEPKYQDKQIPLPVVLKWLSEVNFRNSRLSKLRQTSKSPDPTPEAKTPKTLIRHTRNQNKKPKSPRSGTNPHIVISSCDGSPLPKVKTSKHKRSITLGSPTDLKMDDLLKPIPKYSYSDDDVRKDDDSDCGSKISMLPRWSSSPSSLGTCKKTSQFYCMMTSLNCDSTLQPPMFCRYESVEDCVIGLERKFPKKCLTGLSLSGCSLKLQDCGIQYDFSNPEHAMSLFEILARKGKDVV